MKKSFFILYVFATIVLKIYSQFYQHESQHTETASRRITWLCDKFEKREKSFNCLALAHLIPKIVCFTKFCVRIWEMY